MKLSEKIHSLRKAKGYSQELLAEKSHVSLRTIQRIEANETVPRFHTLKSLAGVLNIEVEKLVVQADTTLEKESNAEGLSQLRLINGSALIGIIIPLLNILLPLILFHRYKNLFKIELAGKRIISFQIFWTFFSTLILTIGHFLYFKVMGEFVSGPVPFIVYLYLALLLINVFFTLRTAIHLKDASSKVYGFMPTLF